MAGTRNACERKLMMSAFKTAATLTLLGILAAALLMGPLNLGPAGNKQSPGPQAPPESGRPADTPNPPVIGLAFLMALVAGLKARSVRSI